MVHNLKAPMNSAEGGRPSNDEIDSPPRENELPLGHFDHPEGRLDQDVRGLDRVRICAERRGLSFGVCPSERDERTSRGLRAGAGGGNMRRLPVFGLQPLTPTLFGDERTRAPLADELGDERSGRNRRRGRRISKVEGRSRRSLTNQPFDGGGHHFGDEVVEARGCGDSFAHSLIG